MSTSILFENSYARLSYDEDSQILILTWLKYTPSAEYREIVSGYYDLMGDMKLVRSICDCRRLPMITMEDQSWTTQCIKNAVSNFRKVHTAIILSGNIYTRISIANVVNGLANYPGYIHINRYLRYFKEEESACAWLLQTAEPTNVQQASLDSFSGAAQKNERGIHF